MRTSLYRSVTIFALYTLYACSNSESVRVINLSANHTSVISSVKWQEADSSRFYYDLRATESFYAFLDDRSDTVIRIYKKDKPGKIHHFHVRKERSILDSRPWFLKSNTRYPTMADQLWIVDNHISVKTINPDNPPEQLLSSPAGFPFRTLPLSTDYNITKEEIYAVPLNEEHISPYYLYRPDSGYSQARIYQHPDIAYPLVSHAFLASLTV
ncbi:MAG: hypothetical protein LBG28_03065, partial [Tannerella sp.]|nr:hypothetical protein [Tannerella sp.]